VTAVPAPVALPDPGGDGGPLAGRRVAVTATRKAAELSGLLERRGATVLHAPTLKEQPVVDHDALRRATETLVADGVDVLVATTGTGVNAWLDAAAAWLLDETLVATLDRADILARGPKAVGALRRHGLRELWSPDTEQLDDVLAHLRQRDLAGRRLVLQEHGQSLAVEAEALRRAGALVTVVSTYRCEAADDLAPVFSLVDLVVGRALDAVTFTSAPAVATLLQVAAAAGLKEELVDAFRSDVLAMCVGPVTAAEWLPYGVPAAHPPRSRLGAMVTALEAELASRAAGAVLEVAGRSLLVCGDQVRVDGVPVRVSGAPLAVLTALVDQPGRVVSRRQLMRHLPSGLAASEHAVEMAVARLRTAIGSELVQTVVKRGYRLPVG
jgi:uroporphyrinogen-III synthase